MRAADERDVQHAGKGDVVGVEPATGEEPWVFLARHARTDESARFHLVETGLVRGVLLGRCQRSSRSVEFGSGALGVARRSTGVSLIIRAPAAAGRVPDR